VRLAIILGLVFVACAIAASVVAPASSNQGFADAASVLAFISLAAVAIERLIEGLYTVLSGRLGQWWPLNLVKAEFDVFEDRTEELLGPILAATIDGLDQARSGLAAGSADAMQIQQTMDEVTSQGVRLSAQFADVRAKLVPGSDRLARVGEINAQVTSTLQAAQSAVSTGTEAAQTAMRTASDSAERAALIIASIQDNPARRLASLALGSSLGMLVAGVTGLNLFVATLVGDPATPSALPPIAAGTLGIVLTGIVIGLGSAPTHEIVRSLQAYKDTRTGGELVLSSAAPSPGLVSEVVTEAAIDNGSGMRATRTVTRTLDPTIRMHRVRRTG